MELTKKIILNIPKQVIIIPDIKIVIGELWLVHGGVEWCG